VDRQICRGAMLERGSEAKRQSSAIERLPVRSPSLRIPPKLGIGTQQHSGNVGHMTLCSAILQGLEEKTR
jgi:hypothetical protein